MKDGVELDRIQIWFETHFNKRTNKWSDARLEDIYVSLYLIEMLNVYSYFN